MSGRLQAIWVKRAKKGPMDPVLTAVLVAGRGIAGNANQGGRRQVTILEEERWAEVLAALEEAAGGAADLPPETRRANLLIAGLPLAKSRGRLLRVGPCLLRVWMECTPCRQMDEARPGLQAALRPDWRAGICAEVVAGGVVTLGDPVVWDA